VRPWGLPLLKLKQALLNLAEWLDSWPGGRGRAIGFFAKRRLPPDRSELKPSDAKKAFIDL